MLMIFNSNLYCIFDFLKNSYGMEIFFILIVIFLLLLLYSLITKVLKTVKKLEETIGRLESQLNSVSSIQKEQTTVLREENLFQRIEEPVVEAEVPETPAVTIPDVSFKPENPVDEQLLSPPEEVYFHIEQPEPSAEERPVSPSRKKSKKSDWESLIGVNLLSKIGIATLVLGIAYFVKYAIDRDWINETGRVAIGILCGGAIIAIAHKLKNKYRTFSSILVGGGIAVLYITVTLAFREYELFSQTAAFILLILITVLSVFLSVFYDRKELALFSLLGGFASPLLVSTGTGNYIVLFSYILILNTGMLVLAFRKQWRLVSLLSYLFTQAFYWSWLILSYKEKDFLGATVFIFAFFTQYYLLALIDHFKQRQTISKFQVFVILSNNLSFFVACLFIWDDFRIDVSGIITVLTAVLNAVPMYLLFKERSVDKRLLYLIIGIVLSFVSLAVPIQLSGCAITMFWAAETVLLLWLWQKSGIRVFRLGFILLECCVLVALMMDWYQFYLDYPYYEHLPILMNKPFITGAVITASVFINARLLRNERVKLLVPEFRIDAIVLMKGIGILLTFFTVFWELRYQIEYYYDSISFHYLIYGLYYFTFAAVIVCIRRNKPYMQKVLYTGAAVSVILYLTFYIRCIVEVRNDTLIQEILNWSYLSVHFASLPAIAFLLIYLLNKRVIFSRSMYPYVYWFIAVAVVFILSMETDNLIIIFGWDYAVPKELLRFSHTVAYPIVWGIISFIFMALGMKRKIRELRIISLALFVLIIAKLYLYDVWKMEQTGRIISFVFLGIVLLSVSFLYQKLKVLLQKKENED